MTDLLLERWIALIKAMHEISGLYLLLLLKHCSYQVTADNNCSKMAVVQCFPAAQGLTRICSMLATWRVSLASSRAVFFFSFPSPSCSLMGYEPKLMNRDKCTWLCFVKEKLPKIRGNAFGCSARFCTTAPNKIRASASSILLSIIKTVSDAHVYTLFVVHAHFTISYGKEEMGVNDSLTAL